MAGLERGYIQVYTGDGKGKTTAALGLALRASGYGLKVFIAQFIKGMKYNEIKALEKFKDNVTVKQYGNGCFIRKEPSERDIVMAKNGLKEMKQILTSGSYDVVILDEINVAMHFNLFKVEDVAELINIKPEKVELVLTGRKVAPEILEMADLVTEMKEIKHYYTKGVIAREGIER
ncbi:MAG: cob(I)yrinic acid a,c-diamide adenosyltransferase [Actinobacteria bacterium]|nr:cob(I)yrinic acid a,c-diamide adenosyltransferase [Actinomycetota bacterium]